MFDRVNNSASEQTGSEDLRIRNNQNVQERIPSTLEEKHATIVTVSHVDKSTVKTGDEEDTTLVDRNGLPDRRHHSDLIPKDEVEARPPDVPHPRHQPHAPHTHDLEIYEELESYIHPDRFNDAVEEQSYDERRSLLVTGRVLPTPILADQRNRQPQNNPPDNEMFLPLDPSLPLPFYWPAEYYM